MSELEVKKISLHETSRKWMMKIRKASLGSFLENLIVYAVFR